MEQREVMAHVGPVMSKATLIKPAPQRHFPCSLSSVEQMHEFYCAARCLSSHISKTTNFRKKNLHECFDGDDTTDELTTEKGI